MRLCPQKKKKKDKETKTINIKKNWQNSTSIYDLKKNSEK